MGVKYHSWCVLSIVGTRLSHSLVVMIFFFFGLSLLEFVKYGARATFQENHICANVFVFV